MSLKLRLTTVENSDIHLDGAVLEECELKNCRLIYSGGPLPVLEGNVVTNCSWHLAGAAGRTLQLLSALRADGATTVVDDFIALVRGEAPQGEEPNEALESRRFIDYVHQEVTQAAEANRERLLKRAEADAQGAAQQVAGQAAGAGLVKWFNDRKGFGFVEPDPDAQNLYGLGAFPAWKPPELPELSPARSDVVRMPEGGETPKKR